MYKDGSDNCSICHSLKRTRSALIWQRVYGMTIATEMATGKEVKYET